MRHDRGSLGKGEKSIEAGHAVRFGGRDIEPLADVIERFRTDPAEAILDCV